METMKVVGGILVVLMTVVVVFPPGGARASPDRLETPAQLTGRVLGVEEPGRDTQPISGALVTVFFVPWKFGWAFEGPHWMDQVNRTFAPHLLPLVIGQTLIVHNSDPFSHNVQFVRVHNVRGGRYRKLLFHGYTEPNGKVNYTFRTPGIIEVRCNMHPSMLAYVHVLADPYLYARTDREGFYRVALPAGLPLREYSVRVWSEREGFSAVKTLRLRSGTSRYTLDVRYR